MAISIDAKTDKERTGKRAAEALKDQLLKKKYREITRAVLSNQPQKLEKILRSMQVNLQKDILYFLNDDELFNARRHNLLMHAALYGDSHIQVIEVLLRQLDEYKDPDFKQALLDDTNSEGFNALMIAVRQCQVKTIKTLIQHGANIDCQNLIAKNCSLLHLASANDNPEIIKLLLDAKVKVNTQDQDGRTALVYAATLDKSKSLEYLLKMKADITIKSTVGTILHDLALHDNLAMARRLVEHKANVNEVNHMNMPPLQMVTTNSEFVLFLLQQKANANTVDEDGWMPLHIAAQRNLQAVKYLVELGGAEINAQTPYLGDTPLMTAAKFNQRETINYLCSQKADVEIPNIYGQKPLTLAISNQHIDLVKDLLKQPGIKIDEPFIIHHLSMAGVTQATLLYFKGLPSLPSYKEVQAFLHKAGNHPYLHHLINQGFFSSKTMTHLFHAISISKDKTSSNIVIHLLATLQKRSIQATNAMMASIDGFLLLLKAIEQGQLNVVQSLIKVGARVRGKIDSSLNNSIYKTLFNKYSHRHFVGENRTTLMQAVLNEAEAQAVSSSLIENPTKDRIGEPESKTDSKISEKNSKSSQNKPVVIFEISKTNNAPAKTSTMGSESDPKQSEKSAESEKSTKLEKSPQSQQPTNPIEIAKYLIDTSKRVGAKEEHLQWINTKDSKQNSAFSIALSFGSLEMVKLLHAEGAVIEPENWHLEKSTPLYQEKMNFLLETKISHIMQNKSPTQLGSDTLNSANESKSWVELKQARELLIQYIADKIVMSEDGMIIHFNRRFSLGCKISDPSISIIIMALHTLLEEKPQEKISEKQLRDIILQHASPFDFSQKNNDGIPETISYSPAEIKLLTEKLKLMDYYDTSLLKLRFEIKRMQSLLQKSAQQIESTKGEIESSLQNLSINLNFLHDNTKKPEFIEFINKIREGTKNLLGALIGSEIQDNLKILEENSYASREKFMQNFAAGYMDAANTHLQQMNSNYSKLIDFCKSILDKLNACANLFNEQLIPQCEKQVQALSSVLVSLKNPNHPIVQDPNVQDPKKNKNKKNKKSKRAKDKDSRNDAADIEKTLADMQSKTEMKHKTNVEHKTLPERKISGEISVSINDSNSMDAFKQNISTLDALLDASYNREIQAELQNDLEIKQYADKQRLVSLKKISQNKIGLHYQYKAHLTNAANVTNVTTPAKIDKSEYYKTPLSTVLLSKTSPAVQVVETWALFGELAQNIENLKNLNISVFSSEVAKRMQDNLYFCDYDVYNLLTVEDTKEILQKIKLYLDKSKKMSQDFTKASEFLREIESTENAPSQNNKPLNLKAEEGLLSLLFEYDSIKITPKICAQRIWRGLGNLQVCYNIMQKVEDISSNDRLWFINALGFSFGLINNAIKHLETNFKADAETMTIYTELARAFNPVQKNLGQKISKTHLEFDCIANLELSLDKCIEIGQKFQNLHSIKEDSVKPNTGISWQQEVEKIMQKILKKEQKASLSL